MVADAFWVAVGTPNHWQLAVDHGIWGLVPGHEVRWNRLSTGAIVFFYATRPISGFVGYGTVRKTFRQDKPLWPPEVQQQKVMWPLRFEFDLGSLVPPTRWAEERILFEEIPNTRLQSGFFELPEPLAQQLLSRFPSTSAVQPSPHAYTHDDVQRILVEIGQIQRFVAEPEYRMGNERLDVVWRKMVQSVPTFAFEVQVGGDVYHALGKLKHARELWNTRVFLVGDQAQFGAKADQLLSSTFHEIRNELRMIDVHDLNRLHELKREVRETEGRLYLV